MRLGAPVPVSEVLEACRAWLRPGQLASLASSTPSVLDLEVYSFDPPEFSTSSSLVFLGPRTPLRHRQGLKAAFALAETSADPGCPFPMAEVQSLHGAMAALLAAFESRFTRVPHYREGPGNQVAATATVEGVLEGGVIVGPGAYVGKGSYIGSGTVIGPNATVLANCRLGRACTVQSGAVIGSAGFGFFGGNGKDTLPLTAMPHPAGVEIGDLVWIGSNTVVASGVLTPTLLGDGCKLDSHVQIAHNVRLGEGCLLASQSGIAGSTVVGKGLRMGGAASVDGHLRIGDGVSVAACSGVTKDLPDGAVVAGFPALPIKEWRRQRIEARRPYPDRRRP